MGTILKPKSRVAGKPKVYCGHATHIRNGNPSTLEWEMTGDKVTMEELFSTSHKGPPFKEGGPFKHRKWELTRSVIPTSYSYKFEYYGKYEGSYSAITVADSRLTRPLLISAADIDIAFSGVQFPASDLAAYGATAFSRMSPLKKGASLGQTLIELKREGLPKIPGLGVSVPKLLRGFPKTWKELRLRRTTHINNSKDNINAVSDVGSAYGSEYLNLVFGWRPLLSDLEAVFTSYLDMDTRISQILRDNGRGVRREGTLDRTNELVYSIKDNVVGCYLPRHFEYLDNTNPSPIAGATQTLRRESRIWFSARFKYYLPFSDEIGKNKWLKRVKLELYGLKPSLELVWELTPWSWLIDYFTNIGEVLDNLSPDLEADLIYDYAFLMRKTTTTKETTVHSQNALVAIPDVVGPPKRIPARIYIEREVSETKERVVASPFGFNLSQRDLSDRQWAILTALGLTRNSSRFT